MEQPTVLRTTKIGGGFVKEDVLTYLDELNTKIESLEKELQDSKGLTQPAVDPHEIAKYRNQIDNLQEKLNKSNQILRETKKENEELKAGKPVSVNPQMQASLDAARKEIENLKGQLKNAGAKGANQGNASLDLARKEIENLRGQLKSSEQKNSELKSALAEQKSSGNSNADSALNVELAKAKQEIAKVNAELKSKTEQLSAKIKESADKDIKITKLVKDSKSSAEKDAEIAQLKAKLENPTALLNDLMNGILNNAQESAEKSKKEAKEEAEKTIKEASERADKIIRDADITAKKTIADANMAAKKTVDEANAAARKTVDEANADAVKTVNDANNKASKLNEMSSTVRKMIINEIESVNSRFTNLSDAINKLSSQTSEKMNEVKTIIDEARKAVESNDNNSIKLAEAPKAQVKTAAAPQNNVTSKKSAVPPAMDGFDDIIAKPISNNSPFSRGNVNTHNQPKSAANNTSAASHNNSAKKPVRISGFDMDDLLKAVEEEAAKGTD